MRNWFGKNLLLIVLYNFLIFAFLLFRREWGISLTFFEIGHLIPVLIINKDKSWYFYAKVVLAILVTVFFWSRADFIIRAFSLLTTIGLNIIIFQEAKTGELITLNNLIQLPFTSLEKFVVYTTSFLKALVHWPLKLSALSKINKSETIKKVAVGTFLALPVLLILIVLFSSADSNFQNIFASLIEKINSFLSLKWITNIELLFDFVFQFGAFWLYLCVFLPYERTHLDVELSLTKHTIEKLTLGILVAGVFAIFIVTQTKSISFILDGFATKTINPGAFVREGFFQLLIATIIGLTVFQIIKGELARSFITLFLLIEIFLVSLVAGERVWLYQYQYGLTQARVWGIVSLLFIITVIAALFLNLKNKINERVKLQIITIGFSFLIFLAGVINIDHLVATTRPPMVDGQIDILHMAENLSWDAADFWIDNLKDTKTGDITYKYKVASYATLYFAQQEKQYINLAKWDTGQVCSQKAKEWLSENTAIAINRKRFCDNYQRWMTFASDYEKEHGITPALADPYSEINSAPYSIMPSTKPSSVGYLLCQVVQDSNKGFGVCEVDVDGIIDVSQSYCESENSHVRAYLQSNSYGSPRRYYATIGNIKPGENIGLNYSTFEGKPSTCLIYR